MGALTPRAVVYCQHQEEEESVAAAVARFSVFFHLIQLKCRCKHTGALIFITAWMQLPVEDIYKHNMIHGEPFLMLFFFFLDNLGEG